MNCPYGMNRRYRYETNRHKPKNPIALPAVEC